jgi:hypothetical protein
MGMGLIFPSLPGRDEADKCVVPYRIGAAADRFRAGTSREAEESQPAKVRPPCTAMNYSPRPGMKPRIESFSTACRLRDRVIRSS